MLNLLSRLAADSFVSGLLVSLGMDSILQDMRQNCSPSVLLAIDKALPALFALPIHVSPLKLFPNSAQPILGGMQFMGRASPWTQVAMWSCTFKSCNDIALSGDQISIHFRPSTRFSSGYYRVMKPIKMASLLQSSFLLSFNLYTGQAALQGSSSTVRSVSSRGDNRSLARADCHPAGGPVGSVNQPRHMLHPPSTQGVVYLAHIMSHYRHKNQVLWKWAIF